MNKEQILDAIELYITSNGLQAISGQILNTILKAITTIVPDESMLTSSYGGVVNPSSSIVVDPGARKWFFANPGTYPNAGNLIFPSGFINILSYNGGTWEKNSIDLPPMNIKKFSDLTFPVVGGTQAVYQNGIWEVKPGETASSSDFPTSDFNSKWQPVGLNANAIFRKVIHPTLEVGALALTNGAVTSSTSRGRTSNFIDVTNLYQIELSGDMLFQSIFYYNDAGTYVANSRQDINAKTFKPTVPATATKGKFTLFHAVNTDTVTQEELNALIVNCYSAVYTSVDDIVENTRSSQVMITDYNNLNINVGDGVYKELGGIDVATGGDSPNDIRIRTAKIKVSSGKYIITQDTGFFISRIFNFKNGIYLNQFTASEFTIDNAIVDEIRIVWAKSNNAVITQAEVDAFKFVLQNTSVPKFQQLLNLSKSKANSSLQPTWFSGKTMSVIGTSLSFGFIPRNYPGYPGQLDSYAKQAAALLGMNFENKGISGSTIGRLASDATANNPMIDRYSSMSDNAKLVIFEGGTNDLRKIHVLGTMSDRIPTTFYGALHILVQGLLNKYVYSKNLVLAKDVIIAGVTSPQTYPDNPISGLTMKDYVNAFKEVCAFYSIPCFDSYSRSGLVPGEFRTLQGTATDYTDMYNPLIPDGTHGGTEVNAVWARNLAGWLKTLVN